MREDTARNQYSQTEMMTHKVPTFIFWEVKSELTGRFYDITTGLELVMVEYVNLNKGDLKTWEILCLV